jgi:hypothetical protein
MKGVSFDVHFAAHRFGIVSRAGGRLVRSQRAVLVGNSVDGGSDRAEIKEFATPGGEVIARRVTALGHTECWLRADLAEAAQKALDDEAAGYAAATAIVKDFIRYSDEQGAARNNTTVEQYRADRHRKGARWDNYRAKQRAGGF